MSLVMLVKAAAEQGIWRLGSCVSSHEKTTYSQSGLWSIAQVTNDDARIAPATVGKQFHMEHRGESHTQSWFRAPKGTT